MLTNNRGISMVEVLVVVGLVALVSSLSAGFIVNQRQQTLGRELNQLKSHYFASVKSTLSLSTTCKEILPYSGVYNSSTSSLMLTDINTINKVLINDTFEVTRAELKYTPVSVQALAGGYLDQTYIDNGSGRSREIDGKLILTFRLNSALRAAFEKQPLANESTFEIPLKMYDERPQSVVPRSWTNVVCSVQNSEEAMFKAQVCNLYGGILTDGSFCDFTMIGKRTSDESIKPPRNIPVQSLSQSGTNRVKRIRLNEILCYIDSLIVMTKDLASVSVPSKSRTTACKHVGGNSVSTMSRDIKHIFDN